jgi:hypothetical protein
VDFFYLLNNGIGGCKTGCRKFGGFVFGCKITLTDCLNTNQLELRFFNKENSMMDGKIGETNTKLF